MPNFLEGKMTNNGLAKLLSAELVVAVLVGVFTGGGIWFGLNSTVQANAEGVEKSLNEAVAVREELRQEIKNRDDTRIGMIIQLTEMKVTQQNQDLTMKKVESDINRILDILQSRYESRPGS